MGILLCALCARYCSQATHSSSTISQSLPISSKSSLEPPSKMQPHTTYTTGDAAGGAGRALGKLGCNTGPGSCQEQCLRLGLQAGR